MKSFLQTKTVIAKDSATERSKSCGNLYESNSDPFNGDCFVGDLNKPDLKLILLAMTSENLKSYQS